MDKNLTISNIHVKTENDFNELGGYLDGEYIFFRVPKEYPLNLSAEWFISIALLEAMVTNRAINVVGEVGVSAQLLKRLAEVQAIYNCWNPDLHIVDVNAKACMEDHSYKAVGSFFSSGVDSSYTLIKHMDDISHLIILRVFDMGDDQASWDQQISSQRAFAASLGKILVPVETNARDWTDNKKIAWGFAHGLLLSAAGPALGLKKLYIASSHTYDHLLPWGSHVLTDPMWSTESTTVIHDGASCRRTEKTREILGYPEVANNLKVCWNSIEKNCGSCPKCIRTMTAIYLLGGEVKSLPTLESLRSLKALRANTDSAATSLEDLMFLAKEVNNERVYRILRGYYRKYQRGKILPMVDKSYFGGFFRRLYRKIKKPRWLSLRVTLRSPSEGDF